MTLRSSVHKLTPEIFDRVKFLPEESESVMANRDKLIWMGDHWGKSDHVVAVALLRDDQIVCLGGWIEIKPGVAETFVIPDAMGVKKFPKEFHRMVGLFIRQLEGLDWVKKIQTASVPVPRIEGWMKALKFRCGGDANSYTSSGKRYQLWSRVKVDGVWQPN